MNYLSVCSGIEAATVAWQPLGWNAWAFSEIEPFPLAVLAHHYPAVPNLGDMTAFHDWPDADFNVLVGGTPCQSFSVAGLRKGLADPRGNLMLTYLAIARRYQPQWLVWENVPGVLSSGEGRDFGTFLGALGELGYGFAYRVLDAQYFGVAQRRRRVFVVGHLGDWRRAAAVLFEPESLSGHPAPRREAGEETTDRVAPSLDASFGRLQGAAGQDMNHGHGHLIANPLGAKSGGGWRNDLDNDTYVAAAFKASHYTRGKDGAPSELTPPLSADADKGDQDTLIAFSSKDHGADAGPLAPTLRSGNHDTSHANAGVPPAVAFAQNQRGELRTSPIAPQLTTGGGKPGEGYPAVAIQERAVTTLAIRGRGDSHNLESRTDGTANAILTPNGGRAGIGVGAVHYDMAVRRLTPRECERLQGFPDDFTQIPWRGKPAEQCPDGPRYRALGNSMAVPVVRWIGERINQVEALCDELARRVA
jgi:DNA (cytosine-5)-methyltransferase 1